MIHNILSHRRDLSEITSASWVKSMVTSGLASQHAHILCCSRAGPMKNQRRLTPGEQCVPPAWENPTLHIAAGGPSHPCCLPSPHIHPIANPLTLADTEAGSLTIPSAWRMEQEIIFVALAYPVPPPSSPAFIKAAVSQALGS